MKEAGTVTEVVAVTAGPTKSQETLRTALAMGADRGIHIVTPLNTPHLFLFHLFSTRSRSLIFVVTVLQETDDVLEPLAVAKILKELVAKESPDLVILGKQAIDGDFNQTGADTLPCHHLIINPRISFLPLKSILRYASLSRRFFKCCQRKLRCFCCLRANACGVNGLATGHFRC